MVYIRLEIRNRNSMRLTKLIDITIPRTTSIRSIFAIPVVPNEPTRRMMYLAAIH